MNKSLPIRVTARAIRSAYHELIFEQRRELPFWMLAAFLITVAVSRAMVYARPEVYVQLWGTHVHHFAWGIIILAATGFTAMVKPHWSRRPLAVLYGIGLGLVADESALWLKLDDVYHSRLSLEIVLAVFLFLTGVVYFMDFWRKAWEIIKKARSRRIKDIKKRDDD